MTLWLLDVALEIYLLILFALTMASSQYDQIIRDPIRDAESVLPTTDDPPCYQLATKKTSSRNENNTEDLSMKLWKNSRCCLNNN